MEARKNPATLTAQAHLLLTVVVAVMFGLVVWQMTTDLTATDRPEPLLQALILVAAVNTLTGMARQTKWQYVLSAATFAAVIGTVAHAFSERSGIPFGPFQFRANSGEKLAGLPWTLPFIWILTLLSSRGVGRLILRPWRKTKTYGFWLIGVTAGLSTLFDLGLDPFLGILNRFWLWLPTRLPMTWASAPLLNFLGWIFVSLLILAFATPLLIKKKPGEKSVVDYHPLVIWAGAMALFAATCARHGLWLPAGVDAGIIVAATVMAVRGAKW